jgi:hypothetical protein
MLFGTWVLKTIYTKGPRWFLDKRRASSRPMFFPTIVPMRELELNLLGSLFECFNG